MMSAKIEDQSPPFRFIALVAMLTALMAMSIDTMLPALGIIAKELKAANPADEALVIMFFFIGNMLGIPLFGPLSDGFGRKPAIFAGLAVFILGALMCFAAWSFPVLLFGRFVQGFGAGSPRVVAMAMVRDGAKGAAMARIMSFVMSVFMLVPIVAPSIGQAVLAFASWHYIFLGFTVMAAIAAIWLWLGQAETLPPENRKSFSAAQMLHAAGEVVGNRTSLGYTIATGGIFGVFTTYLSVCRRIYDEQYGMGSWFPVIFGSCAVCLAAAMIVNGNLVQRLGMRRLSRLAMVAYVAIWCSVLALSFAYVGNPPLAILLPIFGLWFFAAGFTFGNFNAIAMEPMGHIAGMAAAIQGVLSQGLGILLGIFASRYYDGTLTALALIFVVYALIALAFTLWADAKTPMVKKSVA